MRRERPGNTRPVPAAAVGLGPKSLLWNWSEQRPGYRPESSASAPPRPGTQTAAARKKNKKKNVRFKEVLVESEQVLVRLPVGSRGSACSQGTGMGLGSYSPQTVG